MHSQTIGTRAQVWHGTARKTSGGLTKSDLMQNKAGRIVSRAKHNTAKREMRLVKHGYGTKKGEFGFVKIGSHKRSHKKRKMRGGENTMNSMMHKMGMKGGSGMNSFTPANVNSNYMIKDVVPQQFGPLERALVGGRGRGRGRQRSQRLQRQRQQQQQQQQRGGYYGNSFSPADSMGQGIDGLGGAGQGAAGQSTGVQEAAGQAGGRRKKRRNRGMMGGTGSRGYAPADLGSVDVQMAAGRGN
jgi:hypothetical protein